MNTVIEAIHYKKKIPVRLEVEEGIIRKITEVNDTDTKLYICPGFVDLQVNGYMGIDFNNENIDDIKLLKVAVFLLQQGVTSFFPTIITNSIERLSSILYSISQAINNHKLLQQMIPGIHLEGPFLSMEDGPRGAHDKQHIRPPDWSIFDEINKASGSTIKMITLSPEWEGSIEFIQKAVNEGIKVGIGHTNANSEQIMTAIRAGATFSTHLGNGAHVSLPRHPNYIWDQLASDHLYATVIADGFHLPASVLKVIERVKKEKMIVISDSVTHAGLPAGNYASSIGKEVILTDEGKLHLKSDPRLLAGSAQSILYGVNNLVHMEICTIENAIDGASLSPAMLMDLHQSMGLKVGAPADILVFSKVDGKVELQQTIKGGNVLIDNIM